jgi:hypothetical protein
VPHRLEIFGQRIYKRQADVRISILVLIFIKFMLKFLFGFFFVVGLLGFAITLFNSGISAPKALLGSGVFAALSFWALRKEITKTW